MPVLDLDLWPSPKPTFAAYDLCRDSSLLVVPKLAHFSILSSVPEGPSPSLWSLYQFPICGITPDHKLLGRQDPPRTVDKRVPTTTARWSWYFYTRLQPVNFNSGGSGNDLGGILMCIWYNIAPCLTVHADRLSLWNLVESPMVSFVFSCFLEKILIKKWVKSDTLRSTTGKISMSQPSDSWNRDLQVLWNTSVKYFRGLGWFLRSFRPLSASAS